MDVGEIATLVPPTTLVRLVDTSSLDVRVKVHERELARVTIGDAVSAKFPSSSQSAVGVVTFISPEIDPRTRNAELVTRIPNPEGILRAGMFAEIEIKPKGAQQSLIIPTAAVSGTGENRFVFTIANNTAERRKIRVAPIDRDRVEVLEGLQEGEPIVSSGLGRLSEGSPITLGGDKAAAAPAAPSATAKATNPGATP
jgi:RND family efflux transporter MFP subunit